MVGAEALRVAVTAAVTAAADANAAASAAVAVTAAAPAATSSVVGLACTPANRQAGMPALGQHSLDRRDH